MKIYEDDLIQDAIITLLIIIVRQYYHKELTSDGTTSLSCISKIANILSFTRFVSFAVLTTELIHFIALEIFSQSFQSFGVCFNNS